MTIIAFLLFLSFFLTTADGLEVEPETKQPVYTIDIINKPVLLDQASTSPENIILLSSRFGQQYRCQLPDKPTLDTGQSSSSADSSKPTLDVADLLKPLESAPCLLRTKDWWTYEFCYGHQIRQYHLEDNKITGVTIVLGFYESDYNWRNETGGEKESLNRLQRFHSQFYVNGTRCEVSDVLRRAEVRFLCEEGAGDHIAHVEEPESCRYILTVHTMQVCHHPYLRPPPTVHPHPITCAPVLGPEQYTRYQEHQERQKQKTEEKRQRWVQKQEEKLSTLKKEMSAEPEKETPEPVLTPEQKTEPTDIPLEPDPISAPAEQKLKEIKDELHDVSQRLKTELDEVKGEAGKEGDASKETWEQLTDTLNRLLKHLDSAEARLSTASEKLKILTNRLMVKRDSLNQAVFDIEKRLVKEDSSPPATNPDLDLKTPEPQQSDDLDNSIKVQVRKITRDNQNKEETQPKTSSRQTLEKSINEKLENLGISMYGKKVEVKIIGQDLREVNGNDKFQFLSDSDIHRMQKVFLEVLAENKEILEHHERQNQLEQNYEFVWNDENDLNLDDDDD